ncbi:MAG: hypothetical protein CL920_22465 [Deltaproteobacteria bacterium]|nr:hypothetical protein [Deltaproteobacteria bacterium]
MRSTTQIFQTSAKLLLLFIPIILSWSLACGPTESTCTRDSDCNRTQHCSSANRCVTNDEHTDDEKTSGEEQSTQTDGGNHDGPCQPKTCEDQGKNCGQVDDTCGKIIVCGDCPSGETCGANNKPNVCGTGTCTPKTCEQVNAACGEAADGCGKLLTCGACPAGKACKSNQCVCVPKTCKDLGKTCGKVDDGCGNTLDCGVCPKCEPDCPQGYNCKEGVCEGGNPKQLNLNVKTIDISGKITLNGQTPKIVESGCSATSGSKPVIIQFTEKTYGYRFSIYLTCKQLNTSGFTFSSPVYPGVYDAKVRDQYGYTNIPSVSQIVIPTLTLSANKSGLVLDVKTIDINGKITLNGQTPKIVESGCSATSGSKPVIIQFTEKTYGYRFSIYLTCKQLNTSGFTFSSPIYPGVYDAKVRDQYGYTNIPSVSQIVIPTITLNTNKSGIVLDVKTIDISGKITLNGQTPKIVESGCSATSGSKPVIIQFTEKTYGYRFSIYLTCKQLNTSGFTFSSPVYPGVYDAKVRDQYGYTNIPSVSQIVIPTLTLNANKSGIVLDVKTIDISGKITLNGQTPKIVESGCSATSGSKPVIIQFTEKTYGYRFSIYLTCKQLNTTGFTFSSPIYPGVYKMTVRDQYGYTNIPSVAQVIADNVKIP